MKKRTKLIAIISSLCLVLALGIVGVLAVTDLTFNMGGSVVFSATGINATISDGTLTGATVADEDSKLKGFEITTDMTEDDIEAQEGYTSWTGLAINITESTGVATLSFDITNESENAEDVVGVTISLTGVDESLNIETNGNLNIASEETETITITFTVLETEINLNQHPFTVSVLLSNTPVSQKYIVINSAVEEGYESDAMSVAEANLITNQLTSYVGAYELGDTVEFRDGFVTSYYEIEGGGITPVTITLNITNNSSQNIYFTWDIGENGEQSTINGYEWNNCPSELLPAGETIVTSAILRPSYTGSASGIGVSISFTSEQLVAPDGGDY